MSLTAHRDGEIAVVTLEEDGVTVTLEFDLSPHPNCIGALANALVRHGLVRKAVVLSTSEAAGNQTPFEDLEPEQRELVGVFVHVRWCRPEPGVAGWTG